MTHPDGYLTIPAAAAAVIAVIVVRFLFSVFFSSLHSMKSIMNGVRFALLANRWKLYYTRNEQTRKIGVSIRYEYEVAEYLTIIHL